MNFLLFWLITLVFAYHAEAFQTSTLSPFSVTVLERTPERPLSPKRQKNSLGLGHPSDVYDYYGRSRKAYPLIQRHAGDASFDLVTKKEKFVRSFKSTTNVVIQNIPSAWSTTRQASLDLWKRSWWAMPMFLALVPPYSVLATQTFASMPDWWQVVKMDHIAASTNGGAVIAGFLLSNMAYFLSGSYLVKRFPPIRKGIKILPTRYTMLGIWVLLAGLVSTIFHSVQALGPYTVAEGLCYIDHGIAISSTFYFWETCGRPSRRVWAFGLAGFVALVLTHPGYAFLHSSWHFLSAAAATIWGLEGYIQQSTASHQSRY